MASNMVILEIKLLSGFVPDPESVKMVSDGKGFKVSNSLNNFIPQVRRSLLVDLVEEKEDRVLVYFNAVRQMCCSRRSPDEIPVMTIFHFSNSCRRTSRSTTF